MNKKNASSEKSALAVVKTAAVGVFFGAVFIALCLLLLAAGLSKSGSLPQAVLPAFLHGILIGGAVFGGFIGGRVLKKYGLLIGAACGLILCVILAVVKFSVQGWEMNASSLIRYITLVLGGGIGGIIGVNQKSRKKVIRRKNK